MLPPQLRALVLAAFLVPLALPASAPAALSLTHVQAEAVEAPGNGDDYVTPGDFIQIHETVSSASGLTNATGTLLTPTPGVTISGATSAYPDAAAGAPSRNTTPFEATLDGSVPCGAMLQFTLSMNGTGGLGATSFGVPTGAEGPTETYTSAAGAQALNDYDTVLGAPGVTNAELSIAAIGRVKRLGMKIASLSHPRLSDLRLALVAPEGQEVVLAEAGDLNGTALTDAVFSAAAPTSITNGAAPYTGTYRPRGDLAGLEGRLLNGTWTLKVTDTLTGQTGTLNGWSISASRAFCLGLPKASFTMKQNQVPVTETLPGGTILFDASGSTDSDGTITGYAWDLDGDGEFDDGNTPQVSYTYPAKAKVPVRLRVTDSSQLTDIEHKDLPVTQKPVAALSSSPTAPAPLTGETVRLSAAGSSDPDGSIVRHEWRKDANDTWTDTQAVNYRDVTYSRAGTFAAQVRVTDDTGSTDTETVEVVIRNRPPVAAIADPGLVVRDRPATLSAAGTTDPDSTVLTYRWDLDSDADSDSDSDFETFGGNNETLQHTFTTHGSVTLRVKVSDNTGSYDIETRTITVTRAPAVTITATPSPVSLRNTATFDASASFDPDNPGAALTFEWDLENDGIFAAAGPSSASRSWPTAGTRTVKVRVTDPSGAATIGSYDILVRNMLPAGVLSASPESPKVGETTHLSAVGSVDPDGTITRYQWDLDGDNSYEHDTGTTPSTSAAFANHGNVTVGVRLTDNDGGVATKTLTIAVLRADDPPPPPSDGGANTPVAPATDPSAPNPDGSRPPGGDGGEDQPPGTSPERPFGAWLGGAALQRTRQVLARGLLLSCRSEVAGGCRLTVRLAARDAKRLGLGRKAVTVAKGGWAVPAGQSARKRVRLTARARAALRGADGLRLLVRAVLRADDGEQVALTRVVLLRG